MITKTKELKIYGYLMFFFGLLDLAYLSLDLGNMSTLLAEQSKAVAIFVYVFLALCLLITLAKFWMGRQALRYAKGVGKGTSHILLAKIGIFFSVLLVLNDVVVLFVASGDITEAASSVASLVVILSYYQAAKACL